MGDEPPNADPVNYNDALFLVFVDLSHINGLVIATVQGLLGAIHSEQALLA